MHCRSGKLSQRAGIHGREIMKLQISREIRFALVTPDELAQQHDIKNSWAAWPATNRIVPHLILKAVYEGTPDPITGYLCNITLIDRKLRQFVNSTLIPSTFNTTTQNLPTAESIVRQSFEAMEGPPLEHGSLVNVSLHLSPYLSYSIENRNPKMIQLTHQFEFSAAHRLNCDSLTPEQNAATFGKCNNASGHGHNYVVELTVGRNVAETGNDEAAVIGLNDLTEIVNRNVIDPLDHKHLNKDIEHFSSINPSVENISIAIWDWLKPDIEAAKCELIAVKVFETAKTWATYSG